MKKQKRPEKRALFRRKTKLIFRFLKGSKLFFVIAIVTAFVTSLCEMLTPQIIRGTIDNAIGGMDSTFPDFVNALIDKIGGFAYIGEHLWIPAVAVLVVSAVNVVAQYLFRVYNTKGAENLSKTMRDLLYGHISRLPFAWHMKNKTGDIIQRCTSDIDMVKNFVANQLTSIFRIAILLVLSLFFMFSMNVPLALIAMAPLPIIMLYSFVFHRHIGEEFKNCDENEGKLSAMAQENLTGVRVVRAFGRERYERDRFHDHNEYYTGLWVRLAKIMSRFWSTSDLIASLQILLIIVFGAYFCVRGTLTSGEYIAFLSYNSMMLWPVRQLGRMISEMSKAGVSIDRLMYITDSEVECDKEGATDADMTGDIRFEHVSFGYDGCPEMLHDMSFEIKAGTTLGILGGTGSGKSTMMLLLDKLYDLSENGGRITIGGVDIRDIRTEHLRKNIGIVLQEPFLFSRSIAENIAMSDETPDMEKVRDVSRAACLDDAVMGFAAGYDTFVGERGVTLSGGQKQRVAIARNLLRDAPIMIFDDSLSAVDTETDAKIRAELVKRFGKASTILISHRITTLCHADQILVIENGRITEAGTHDELKSAGGIYQKIYETQMGGEVTA